jgi:hypothetical protein
LSFEIALIIFIFFTAQYVEALSFTFAKGK